MFLKSQGYNFNLNQIKFLLKYIKNLIKYFRVFMHFYIHIPFCESKCNYCAFTSLKKNDYEK
ncbi:hypothetical protein GPH41_08155, partial [Campylobacter jejuni]|nr:hypothetical protein [Campylobacter jejuni]